MIINLASKTALRCSRGPTGTSGSSLSVQTWRDRQWRNAAAAAPNGARRGFRTTAPAAAAAGDDNDDNENNKKKDEPEYREDSDDDDDDDDFSDGEQDGEDVMPPRDMPLQVMVKTVTTPEQVLVVPVIKTSIMPGTMGRATVRDPEFLKELQELRQKHPSPYIGLFIVKDAEEAKQKGVQITTLDQLHQTGVLGVLTNVVPMRPSQQKDGVVGVIQFLSVHKRIKIDETVSGTKRLVAKVSELQDKPYDPKDPQIRGFQAELEAIVHRIGAKGDVFARDNAAQLLLNFWTFHNPLNAAESADFVAGIITHIALDDAAMQAQQAVIEELDVSERLKKTLALTKRELSLSDLTQKIKEYMEERHRQMTLRDELKAIRTELGLEQPQTETLMAKFKERIKDKQVPEHAAKVINEEMEKFQHLSPSSTEYNVVRTYLDWLTTLPWDTLTKDNLDMHHAEKVLEDEHYGLKDVKERILEFIAVGALKGEVTDNDRDGVTCTGKIICLVGPPGVGKTSIGKSIANALQREFFRFSVGGMTDEAEIKGHRRTYVGAMPGKLLQALKRVKTSNPVVLLDEVDKVGTSSYKGDPSSALLEVLDPSQNTKFLDHYLDVSYDLSKVLFICTANVLHTIPRPLLDRMEVIRLSGYVEEEKVAIAERYLVPKAVSEAGLSEIKVNFEREALHKLIHSYAREAGVRNLQQQIDKIMRKVAHQVVVEQEKRQEGAVEGSDGKKGAKGGVRKGRGKKKSTQERADESAQPGSSEALTLEKDQHGAIVIKPAGLGQFLGKPPFSNDRYYDTTPPGVVMGLAWTSMGGSTPYIETVVDKHQLLVRKEEKRKRREAKEKEKNKKTNDDVASSESPATASSEDDAEEEGGSGSGRLITTGQMGEVMQESCSIAYTCAKIFWNKLGQTHKQTATSTATSTTTTTSSSAKRARSPQGATQGEDEGFDEGFFRDVTLHMHIPEGATPKDGPSAGIGMVSSLLSLGLGTALRQDVAMTGEITLTGKVLPVGGIKEKVIAARRAGVKTLVFPEGNRKDWDELEPFLREGLDAHFVDYYGDVFQVVFPDAPKEYHQALRRTSA
ncbi:ATPdependent protease La, putative [Acanthamoeba castellanii str. Neff]|uniref:endopeptidase La n=1 Tax=Acanthamoeba castellanii (strain ATCC 30010 / Neff) TaxID=1257118 RepID=L8GW39_ACACF|nr:ATPdependent protease La, putative [Acanthamoeba castellanii str. Neff]ELR16818.1 ATPdependent protease La, putative [Acanthamoeba castellanii str. Neff]